MKRPGSALYSTYIIDGTQMPHTPAQMLESCMDECDYGGELPENFESIVDETTDPAPKKTLYSADRIPSYVDRIREFKESIRPEANVSSKSYTKRKIAAALTDALWKKGHFMLEDLGISVGWKWNCAPLGNMAAFYFSAEAASEYIFDLNVRLDSYSFEKSQDMTDIDIAVTAEAVKEDTVADEYDFINEQEPREMRYCWISDEHKCGKRLEDDPSSWLIYIPFDSCEYRLGNSVFEKVNGASGDNAPEICDPDYFMDCFEVIRELVEDGVIISGTTVGPGGLAAAAADMSADTGICIDISGIERASGEADVVRILFSEVPGVLIQIKDADYDYVDAQLLLQDIAYFPIGHPGNNGGKFSVTYGRKPGVSAILASLIQDHYSEGED